MGRIFFLGGFEAKLLLDGEVCAPMHFGEMLVIPIEERVLAKCIDLSSVSPPCMNGALKFVFLYKRGS